MKKILLLKQWILFVLSGIATNSQAQTVVSDCNWSHWQKYLGTDATMKFGNGPAAAPLPNGSIRFLLGKDGVMSKALVATAQYAHTPLAHLTELKYWTYVQNYLKGQAPAIEIYVDLDGNGTSDDRLVFEPVYQRGNNYGPAQNNGKVLLHTWQQWDALIGGWWTAHDRKAGPPTNTLSTYIQAHPKAAILVIILTTGGGHTWNHFSGSADALKIGVNGSTTTYNFEACESDKKVTVCHKGNTITIDPSEVKAHLDHGDQLGPCGTITEAGNKKAAEEKVLVPPARYELSNYPNPFTATTRIRYGIPVTSNISLKVYDVVGREIATLFNGTRKTGNYSMEFNAAHLIPGMYFYVLSARSEKGMFTQTRTMMLVKE